MVTFFINHFQGSRVERISCDSESSTDAKENIVEIEKYYVSYFSIICDDFLLHRYRIQKHNRLTQPRNPGRDLWRIAPSRICTKGRNFLRISLTPYVKLFTFKRNIRNPWLHLFPETKQNHICRCLWDPNKARSFRAHPQRWYSS